MPNPTALITGATAGIGHEFASQLAARQHDLVIVARDTARLVHVAADLRKQHGVAVEVLTADLSTRVSLGRVAERLADPQRPVDLLVNNAGFSLKGRFLDHDIAAEERQFDVLTRAVLVLSHAAANAMRERGHGGIVNVSSVAGFMASGTYSASKAFVTTFTEGLAAELAGTGVLAMALCPGFTRTEFHQRAELDMSALPDVAWLRADDLVSAALDDLARGRVVSVPGWQYKAAVGALKVLPRGLVRNRSAGAHRPG